MFIPRLANHIFSWFTDITGSTQDTRPPDPWRISHSPDFSRFNETGGAFETLMTRCWKWVLAKPPAVKLVASSVTIGLSSLSIDILRFDFLFNESSSSSSLAVILIPETPLSKESVEWFKDWEAERRRCKWWYCSVKRFAWTPRRDLRIPGTAA